MTDKITESQASNHQSEHHDAGQSQKAYSPIGDLLGSVSQKLEGFKVLTSLPKHYLMGVTAAILLGVVLLGLFVYHLFGTHVDSKTKIKTKAVTKQAQSVTQPQPIANPLASLAENDHPIRREHQRVQNKAAVTTSKIDEINLRLAKIEQALQTQKTSNENQVITRELDSIRSDLQSALSQNVSSIKGAVDTNNQILVKQIAQMRESLSALQQKLEVKPHTLDKSALPFVVSAIDNIEQSRVVTVRFAHRFVPLNVGESLSGWRLVSASEVNQKCEFENTKGDFVSIDLNEINTSKIKVMP